MPPPRVWLVVGDKRGDNGQVEAVAAALPWPCERRYVHMLPRYQRGKPRFSASLRHLDRRRSDPLEPPWPELILTVGRRPSMAALWIKRQSGGRSKVVLVGKPTGRPLDFDLIVCSAEKLIPPLSNCMPIGLPMMRIDERAVAVEAEAWRGRWSGLPRPIIAFLVGGATSPYTVNRRVAGDLLALARWVRDELGGTPYFTTSRRTPESLVAGLRAGLPPRAALHEWSASGGDNPYRALLGLAEGFIVTGDSISMMLEVASLRKPLAIYELPYAALGRLDQLRRSLARRLFDPRRATAADRLRHGLARLAFRLDVFMLLSATRDFRAFHQLLVERGLARWAGEPFQRPTGPLPDAVPEVAARIGALLGRPRP